VLRLTAGPTIAVIYTTSDPDLQTDRQWSVNRVSTSTCWTAFFVDDSSLQREGCRWMPQWTDVVLVRWMFLGNRPIWSNIELCRSSGDYIQSFCSHVQFSMLKPGIHRLSRRDSTVELSRVGRCVAYSPIGSRDPFSNFCSQLDRQLLNTLKDAWNRIKVHMKRPTNMFSFQFFNEIRRELVANSVHTADANATRLDSTVESRRRRRCVLGITVFLTEP